jgi:hypothetical protein
MRITEILESIKCHALALGFSLDDVLGPSASDAYMDSICASIQMPVSHDVRALFRWRNGVWPAGQRTEIRLFPGFFYPPFHICEQHYRERGGVSGWRSSWFPVFTDGAGDYFVIETLSESEDEGRILRITNFGEPRPAFWSFQAMLASILSCYEHGAYFLDEDGFLDEDHEVSIPVYRKLNLGLSPFD